MSADHEWIITTNIPEITFGVMAPTHDDAVDVADVVLTEVKIKTVTRVEEGELA